MNVLLRANKILLHVQNSSLTKHSMEGVIAEPLKKDTKNLVVKLGTYVDIPWVCLETSEAMNLVICIHLSTLTSKFQNQQLLIRRRVQVQS